MNQSLEMFTLDAFLMSSEKVVPPWFRPLHLSNLVWPFVLHNSLLCWWSFMWVHNSIFYITSIEHTYKVNKIGIQCCYCCFQIGTEPSDNQYLVVDIGLAAVPIIMIGNNGPHDTLVKQKPTRHLLSFLPLFSVISFLLFQTLCYIGVWFFVRSHDWLVYI